MLARILSGYGFRWTALEELPAHGGTYLLALRLEAETEVHTRAKSFLLRAGSYVYVGSAQNISARVGRHLSERKSKHWHIDYLLEHAAIEGVMVSRERVEVEVALRLASVLEYIPGFGCSDSAAPSHLFYLKNSSLQSILPGR